MDNLVYSLAIITIILGVTAYFKGIFTLLFNKLRSVHLKIDFANKDTKD